MIKLLEINRISSIKKQMLASTLAIIATSLLCYAALPYLGYRVVALILLVMVSILAMLLEIKAVLMAAVLSSLIWNFFFIPPILTFHIDSTEDALMFLMYFLVAMVNAVLSSKIREIEKKIRDKEEKEKTIQLYNSILNSLSHELRTPVATIIGTIDTIKENRDRISEEVQSNLLTEIEIASNRLNIQVENLLNMSRLESGILKLKMDWCDLEELLYGLTLKLPNEDRNRVQLEIPEDTPLIKVDSILLEQAIYNILHNALIYSSVFGKVEIIVNCQDKECLVSILDNGPGFPLDTIEHVFDKFYRLPKTKTGGTGLGLSIAKGFVVAHGGFISLQNRKSGGADFTIHLPVEFSYLKNLKNE